MRLTYLYGAAQRLIIRKTFLLWQYLGFYISSNNFYEPFLI